MEKNKYAQKEEEILKFWQEKKIFERSVTSRPENEPYVFYDGPPFATGLPHYGHILSSVTKDVFPRYWTMKGKRVRRRWGWDCHGLPIETLVEKELGISGKKQIEAKGVDVFNKTARDMVLNYATQWKEMIERIGRWVEFEDSYKTMDSTYMESVWWALKQIWDKDLIYEGRKVLLYCPRCETPVSNAEIQMDNSYRDVTEDSAIVKFKLKPGQKFGKNCETMDSAYILAWTTTPWTLPANVALAVGCDVKYSALRIKGVPQLYIVASALVEEIFKGEKIEIVHDDLTGGDLEGLEYEPLFEIPAVRDLGQKAWYVAPADFVTTEEGTGVVHTAVMYGEDDFALGLELDLPQVPLLDSSGHYNKEAPEFLQGKFIKDAEEEILDDLDKRGLVFKTEPYTHSYPHCWRCESPLIYNAISAWFINIQKIKSRLIELNEKINWYPGNLKSGRFLNILETAPDWNISRNRYWATPLPFFKCESDKCEESICIGSVKELREKAKNFSQVYKSDKVEEIDLHKPYIDQIIISCPKCSGDMHRISEVIDCWVESGSMPFAEWHYPFENKEEFESRFPGQFIGEYIAQTRAWFYYMHVVSALLFDNISFENVVATGTILSEKGEKLSKSKKNYPDPWQVINQFGTDSLRFYLMSSVVMQADNLFFSEKDLRETYNKIINILYNVLGFYLIYKDEIEPLSIDQVNPSLLDKFILSRIENTKQSAQKYLDSYNTVKYCREIRGFVEDLSLWWLRRSRDRFRSEEIQERQSAISTLKYVLRELSIIIAPVTPFVSEIMWQEVKDQTDEESVHLSYIQEPKTELVNNSLEESMTKAREIVEIGHSIRSKIGVKVRQPLAKIYFNYDFKEEKDQILRIILPELNIEEFSDEIIEPEKAKNQDLEVIIETKIDERLRRLGDIREVTRAIQSLRKKRGLKPSDMVELFYFGDKEAEDFVENLPDVIKTATNLSKLSRQKTEEFTELEISLGMLYFSLR